VLLLYRVCVCASQALQQLRIALGAEADACDTETLAWLLRDRKLDVEKATAKVCACPAQGHCTQVSRVRGARSARTCSGAPVASLA
jgi:hypothetical protein